MRLVMAEIRTFASDPLAEREGVLRVLHEQAPRLRARGITALSLFGSVARGEAGPKSDIDLLIATDPAARFGLSDLLTSRRSSALCSAVRSTSPSAARCAPGCASGSRKTGSGLLMAGQRHAAT